GSGQPRGFSLLADQLLLAFHLDVSTQMFGTTVVDRPYKLRKQFSAELCREPDFQLIKLSYPADRSTLSQTKPYLPNAQIPRAFERTSHFARGGAALRQIGTPSSRLTRPIGNRSCRASR